jgi:hypothetical protein
VPEASTSWLTGSLGIDTAGFVAYIENEKPGYLQLEAWVKEHARNLTPESIAAFNHNILTRDMNAEMAGERRERFGIADPRSRTRSALTISTTGTRHTAGSRTRRPRLPWAERPKNRGQAAAGGSIPTATASKRARRSRPRRRAGWRGSSPLRCIPECSVEAPGPIRALRHRK